MTAHRAFLELSGAILESHLPLPDDTTILDAKWIPASGTLQLLVSHPSLRDLAEGETPGRCSLHVQIVQPGGRKIAQFHSIDTAGFQEAEQLHDSSSMPPDMVLTNGERR